MSIVRIGLGETKGYADGYDAIFKKKGAKKPAAKVTTTTDQAAKVLTAAVKPAPAKKPAGKKK